MAERAKQNVVKEKFEQKYVNFYGKLPNKNSSSKQIELTWKEIATQFEEQFLPQIMILAKTREITMEFDYSKELIIGRFQISASKWNKFWKDIATIKLNLEKKGVEVLFTNNASKTWKDVKASQLSKVKFSKATIKRRVKNIAFLD